MTDTLKQDDTLVHWTYSQDEWKNFTRWKKKKKGFFYYLLHLLAPGSGKRTPGISISPNKVSIDDIHVPFHDGDRRLRRVNIRDAGDMNIMELCYHCPTQKERASGEINILVPKGKLREAIQLQEKLTAGI
jgi:hypothetical protein